jgi:NADH-quinone oxidoreductase subunit E
VRAVGRGVAARHLQDKLGIGFGQTTADGALHAWSKANASGACGDAPVLLVNNKQMHGLMNPEKIDAVLDQLAAETKR